MFDRFTGDITIPAHFGKNHMTPHKLFLSIIDDKKTDYFELFIYAKDLLARIEGVLIGRDPVPFVGRFSYYVDQEWHYPV